MALDIEGFTRWLEGKRAEVAAEEPLSIQASIAALSHELNIAQGALEKIRAIHRPDPTSSWCVYVDDILRALDGDSDE